MECVHAMSVPKFLELIAKIKSVHASIRNSFSESCSIWIKREVDRKIQYQEKRVLQQASILGNLETFGVLKESCLNCDTTSEQHDSIRELERDTNVSAVVEFGAGRGYLTQMLADCYEIKKVLLVERKPYKLKGLHQLQRTDDLVTQNLNSLPFSLSPYILRPIHFHTTACESIEILDEQKESALVGNKTKDSADVFREWGCSENDITMIFKRRPCLRKVNIQILQSELEILSQWGFKSADLVRIVHCRPRFLSCTINVFLSERLKHLEDLFGSREILVKAIVRNPSLLTYDFHNRIKPVVALYESVGLTKQDIITMLRSRPTLITHTNLDDEKMDYIRRTGVSKESKLYKYVVAIFAVSRIETIRDKLMNLEKYGISEDEILVLIGRSPLLLTLSIDKVQRNMTFVLGALKLSARAVLCHPSLLYRNLETVLKPRFQIACMIEDMGLVPQIKGPKLMRALRMKEERFISAYITLHPQDVAEELMTAYENAKSVKRLAVSSKKIYHKGFPF